MEGLKTFAQREQEKEQIGDTEFRYVHDCPKGFVEPEEHYPLMDDDLEDILEYYECGRIKRNY